jgi:parvulin-like peptidyl-prolyl isomerase
MLTLALPLALLSATLPAQDTDVKAALANAAAEQVKDHPQTLLAARGTAEVLVADVDAFMEHVPERDRAAVVSSDERIATFLQGMLLNRQLSAEAVKHGLHESEVVQRELQLAREQVLARHAIKHHVASKPATNLEQLAREAYMVDKSKFATPEVRLVQHILINNSERSDAEALERVAKVQAELGKPDANFDELVQTWSDDQGKLSNNGYYRIDAESEPKMDPSFVAGARTVNEVGAITKPIVGMYGYHLIRLASLQQAKQLSFEEAKPGLIQSLQAAYNKRVEDELVSDLRAQNPEIVTEVAQRLKSRYGKPPTAPQSAPGSAP